MQQEDLFPPVRPRDKPSEDTQGNAPGDEITDPSVFLRQVHSFRCDEDVTAAYHRHEQRRDERNQVSEPIGVVMDLRFMPVEPDGARP